MPISNNLKEKINAIYSIARIKNVFLFEHIPSKKLTNAKQKYAFEMGNDEDVVLLYDDTLFGTAKKGFLLTTKRLYSKNILEKEVFTDLVNIDTMIFKGECDEETPKIFVGTVFGEIALSICFADGNVFVNALEKTVELLTGRALDANRESGEESSSVCKGCGALVSNGYIECEYCGLVIS